MTGRPVPTPNDGRGVGVKFAANGLPQMLGIESAGFLALLDGLAVILDNGWVFDWLGPTDARRVGGSLAWLCVPAGRQLTPAELVVEASVRAAIGLDGIAWRGRRAVRRAFDRAAIAVGGLWHG